MSYLLEIVLSFTVPVLWLMVLRPYCIRHGKGFTPGASMGVTLWVDWQQGREIAREKGHTGMRVVCGVLFCILALHYFGLLLVLLLEVARQAP